MAAIASIWSGSKPTLRSDRYAPGGTPILGSRAISVLVGIDE